jgi:hypothetical protein
MHWSRKRGWCCRENLDFLAHRDRVTMHVAVEVAISSPWSISTAFPVSPRHPAQFMIPDAVA